MGINNQLTLRPRVDADNIQRRIEDALKRSAEVDAEGVHVKVQGDVVILEGKVNSWHQRQIAERTAWSVPGVKDVKDQIVLF